MIIYKESEKIPAPFSALFLESALTGDSFSGKNMNDLEDRIEAAFADCPRSAAVKNIDSVQTLPSDAASHTDTLYLVIG